MALLLIMETQEVAGQNRWNHPFSVSIRLRTAALVEYVSSKMAPVNGLITPHFTKYGLVTTKITL